ncbi:hypothetical protein K9M74_01110 [Candidatus Woesearchaeota archaeon]|nr:hypothetical protein [Candidatus Woesearchaeota archaeon]
MSDVDTALDALESQVLLYRYSVRRENPKLDEKELRVLMRKKVNSKFQKESKKIMKDILQSHFDLLN